MKKRSVPMGMLALVFFATHAGMHAYLGQFQHVLWACNVATLGVGIGLLLPSATINAIGAFWLTVGLPLWLLDLVLGRDLHFSTLLPHIGGLILGYIGIRRLGLPDSTWWTALVAMAGLVVVCRLTTSPSENVNLAFGPYEGTRHIVPSHLGQLAITMAGFTLAFVILQRFLKLGFQEL